MAFATKTKKVVETITSVTLVMSEAEALALRSYLGARYPSQHPGIPPTYPVYHALTDLLGLGY